MDRSRKGTASEAVEGTQLLNQLVELSGLPEKEARSEIDAILGHAGVKGEETTLESLRAAMLSYLEALDAEMSKLSDDPAPPVQVQ